MTPVISGWSVHVYAQVPGSSKTRVKLSPCCRVSLANLPSSAVTSWAATSSLTHVTLDPRGTSSDAGS
jgi:hypothetical protein